MEEAFEYVNVLNCRKVIFMLESKKSNALNSIFHGYLTIPELGRVKNLNLLQYVLGKYIIEQGEDLWNIAMQIYRRCGPNEFCFEDSDGNNIIHYLSIIGEINIIKDILKTECPIKININGVHPIDFCKNKKLIKLIQSWSKISSPQVKTLIVSNDKSNVSETLTKYEQSFKNMKEDGLEQYESPKIELHGRDNVVLETGKEIGIINNSVKELEESIILEDKSLEEIIIEETDNNKYIYKGYNPVEIDESLSKLYIEDEIATKEHNNSNSKISECGCEKTKESKVEDKKYMVEIEKRKTEIEKAEKRDNTGMSHYISRSDIKLLQQLNLPIENLQVNLFPGKVYIVLDKIICNKSGEDTLQSISVRIEQDDNLLYSEEIQRDDLKKLGEVFALEFTNKNIEAKIKIKATFSTEKKIQKKYSTDIKIIKNEITQYQNRRITYEETPQPKNNQAFLKFFKTIFSNKSTPAIKAIKYTLTYIADEDSKLIQKKINNLKDLNTWIRMRHHFFTIWYKGYANCRGNKAPCTMLWMRRYIIWRGYTISLFNEFSGTHVGDIYMNDSEYTYYDKKNNNFITENTFKLEGPEQTVEINLDNYARFENCLAALSLLYD